MTTMRLKGSGRTKRSQLLKITRRRAAKQVDTMGAPETRASSLTPC